MTSKNFYKSLLLKRLGEVDDHTYLLVLYETLKYQYPDFSADKVFDKLDEEFSKILLDKIANFSETIGQVENGAKK